MEEPNASTPLNRSRSRGWTDYAACEGMSTDVFFPQQWESIKPAEKICHRCPVIQECLEYAITNEEWYGIWGGLSENRRRELIRQKRREERREGSRTAVGRP